MNKLLISLTLSICIFIYANTSVIAFNETVESPTTTISVSTETDVFDAKQNPVIKIVTKSSFKQDIYRLISGVFRKNTVNNIYIVSPSGKKIIEQDINDELTEINFVGEQKVPGKYQVFLNDELVADFSWGVIAINSNKSIYMPDDIAELSFAVLDDKGITICDSQLDVTITDPEGNVTRLSTSTGEIIVNPECLSREIVEKADYEAVYEVKSDGIYNINLSSTSDGTTTNTNDSFKVDSNEMFDVERITATRIYPQNIYPVKIKLTAKEDFEGTYTEKVPADFTIYGDTVWPISLKTGEYTELLYYYDAPDISPEFYLLGPSTIKDTSDKIVYTEYRPWQIAVDAVAHEQTVTGSSLNSTTVTSASITAANDQLYLAAISTKVNKSVVSISGLGLTWNLVKAICGGRAQTRTEVWYAIGTPSGSGTVAATITATPEAAVIVVSRYSGVDTSLPIGNYLGKNSNGIDGACTGGTDANSYTADLTTTVDGSIAYGAVGKRQNAHTPGTGYTERADIITTGGGNAAGIATEDKTVATAATVAVNGTIDATTDYSFIALEIKPYVASNSAPNAPALNSPADTATNQSPTLSLLTTATDTDSDYLRYKIELCTNVGMSTGCQTFDQTSSQTGWTGQNAETNTAYTSGTQATYTIQSALASATTYYWRSYAIDPGGTNTWSGTQTPRSFTTTTAPTAPTSLLTEGSTNPTSVVDLTPEFSAIHNDPDSDAAIYSEIEVNTAADFTGTVMWDSGKTSMSSTASGARSPDISYAGTALGYNSGTYHWRIRFWDSKDVIGAWSAVQTFKTNTTPTAPALNSPADTATNQSPTLSLSTTATDTDSDYLRYKIELCTNVGMSTGCQTFDQTSSQTGWTGQNAETNTAYTSGTQATYTIQSALASATTYYWRSYAIDPGGTNTWSGTQTPRSFTIRYVDVQFNFKGLNLKGINLR